MLSNPISRIFVTQDTIFPGLKAHLTEMTSWYCEMHKAWSMCCPVEQKVEARHLWHYCSFRCTWKVPCHDRYDWSCCCCHWPLLPQNPAHHCLQPYWKGATPKTNTSWEWRRTIIKSVSAPVSSQPCIFSPFGQQGALTILFSLLSVYSVSPALCWPCGSTSCTCGYLLIPLLCARVPPPPFLYFIP